MDEAGDNLRSARTKPLNHRLMDLCMEEEMRSSASGRSIQRAQARVQSQITIACQQVHDGWRVSSDLDQQLRGFTPEQLCRPSEGL